MQVGANFFTAQLGPIEQALRAKLENFFSGDMVRIRNESLGHSFQQQVDTGSSVKETHFNILVVSEKFAGLALLKRHRMVQQCIIDEAALLRAISLNAFTPAEWAKKSEDLVKSPACASAKIPSDS